MEIVIYVLLALLADTLLMPLYLKFTLGHTPYEE